MLNPKPGVVNVEITRRCQNNCYFCFVLTRNDGYPRNAEMSLENFKKIIDLLAEHVPDTEFGYMGGEPVLHRDFFEMARYVRESTSYNVHVSTNGLKFADLSFTRKFLDSEAVDGVQVTIHSCFAEVHDKMVGRAGAWEKTVKGLKNLIKEGGTPSTNTSLTKLNAPHFLETMEFLAELGVRGISVNLATPMNKKVIETNTIINDREFASIVLKAQKKAEELGVSLNTLHSYNLCVFNPIPFGLRHYPCSMGSCMCYIDVGCNLLACYYYSVKIGNVIEEGLEKLWHSEKYNYFRRREYLKKLSPACLSCKALNSCGGPCPLRLPLDKEHLHPYKSFY